MSMPVGYSEVELVDEQIGVQFPMVVMYPTDAPGKRERLGPYGLNGPVDEISGVDISVDAVPEEGVYPLVIISHGTGGRHLLYRTLAYHLASNGFIVGMPEHPFNNRNNNTWEGTLENLTHRPRHIRLAIDWFFKSSTFSSLLKPGAVAIIGHSMGGYTALAAAGGVPNSLPHESQDGQSHQICVTPDPRINALVLLAPATPWFALPGALSKVTCPILMFMGEKDESIPSEYYARFVLNGVPDRAQVQYRIVENAGHFSFLSPFPEGMTSASFPPSQDPPGFDRVRFHQELNVEVLGFLMHEISA